MKNAVKSGVYVGVLSIIFVLLAYVIEPTYLAKWWFGIGILVINLGLVIYFGLQYRKEEEGYLTFKEGFLHGFVLLLVAGIIGTVFQILLYTVIDPELPQIITEAMVAQQEAMLQKFGMQGAQLDEAIEKIKEETPKNFTAGGLLKSYAFGTIFYLIISLITGAIVKKSEPEFE
tara:strand:- start:608 stop:1129 length:522 start_codon:yes stop_codon:yes gene_type:complete